MTEIGATYAAHLTHQHDRERRSRHLKIHAAIVVHLHRGRKIELIIRDGDELKPNVDALLAFHAEHGRLLYTGDFKLRPSLAAEPCATVA